MDTATLRHRKRGGRVNQYYRIEQSEHDHERQHHAMILETTAEHIPISRAVRHAVRVAAERFNDDEMP